MKKQLLYVLGLTLGLVGTINTQAQVLSEDFESGTFPPTGWAEDAVSGTVNWATGNGNNNGSVTAANSGSTNAILVDASGDPDSSILETPRLDITGGVYELTFSYTLEDWAGDQDELHVYYKTSAAGAWVLLNSYSTNVDVWTEEVILLPNPSANYYIGFAGVARYGRGVTIDDVVVDLAPNCLAPSALATSNVMPTSVDLAWTENGTGTSWQIEYGATNFMQGTGTTVVTGTNPHNLSGLTPATNYDFYVRTICAPGDTSDWSGPLDFSTACGPTQTELYLTTSGGLYTGEKWVTITTMADGAGTVIWAQGNGTLGDESGLVTDEPFCVDNGVDYYINAYDAYDDSWDGTIYEIKDALGIVVVNNGGNTPDDGTDADATGAWEDAAIELESSEMFSYTPSTCPQPTALTAANVTINSVDLSWTENGSAVTWNVQYGAAGFTLGTGDMITGPVLNPHHLPVLSPSTDYEFYVQADCGGTDTSDWSGPMAFSTLCAPVTPDYTWDVTTWLAACWDVSNAGDTLTGPTGLGTSDWEAAGFLNDGSGVGGGKINIYSAGNMDWIVSPEFDLSGGTYELKVGAGLTNWNNAAIDSMGTDDMVRVLVTEDAGSTWSTLHEWNKDNEPANVGDTTTIDLSALSGTVRFGIWATDGTTDDINDYDFHIGYFEVSESTVTAINEHELAGFSIFPNPNNGQFTIANGGANTNAVVEVMDLQGKVVFQNTINFNAGAQHMVNVGNVDAGMYILRIRANDKVANHTFIVK